MVSALLIRLAAYSYPGDAPPFEQIGASHNDPGVQIEVLAAAIELPSRSGEWTFALSRATIAAGTVIPPHAVPGAELLYVERGSLTSELDDCEQRCVQTAEDTAAFVTDRVSLPQERGLSAAMGAVTAYQAEGQTPTDLLILTLIPPQAGPSPA